MKTWLVLKTEIMTECNIQGEEFVSSTELLNWANDAKDEAEAEIISLQERYLETEAPFNLTQAVDTYALPLDIYAAKISGMYFNDGTDKYEIVQIRDKADIMYVQPADRYRYRLTNPSSSGIKVKLYPLPRETSSTIVSFHYIRTSNRLIDDTSKMDIPVAEGFIKQYVKDKVREKEIGPLNGGNRSMSLEKQKSLLIEALVQKTPDDSSDQLKPDMGFYDMSDNGDYYGW